MAETSTSELQADSLLAWYDRHRRDLPWRARPGETADPYRVWLSEIMLQQTQVQAVIPYFLSFLERWPDVGALGAAPREEVMAAWAGLGYYARARRLHDCARQIAGELDGVFPDTEAGLRALPGIGAYTSGAVAAIAFDRPAAAVDGNVERVMARSYAIGAPMPAAKKEIRKRTQALVPTDRPGDFAQALMDLGATICTPRRPACGLCPWRDACAGRLAGIAEELPRPAPRKERPHRHGLVFWLERDDGAVLLRTRPDEGLLGGMMEAPTTPWREAPWTLEEALPHAPLAGDWELLPDLVRHGFTHFTIDLKVAVLSGATAPGHGSWHHPESFDSLALPTLTRKVVRHAFSAGRRSPR
ncbi:MAG: A/G-specific adenine glycosylase [Rhodospirillaceae bacterium]|jgi:A/G-specific adenine glycosylase|nr:A/G-specific adenine glycosylase [Rhodospirillaceae bacterium]MBT6204867.1 A/G-specific adenine glycosylase [Rhodospirillaceae bacterium]MBT6511999.1 A/G-specific adenine glycosylase [Rhodospirillaceae bacterium]MBT7648367.1 A/G-specific adenine glycosylase [Rhodospirillaceae bacterium]